MLAFWLFSPSAAIGAPDPVLSLVQGIHFDFIAPPPLMHAFRAHNSASGVSLEKCTLLQQEIQTFLRKHAVERAPPEYWILCSYLFSSQKQQQTKASIQHEAFESLHLKASEWPPLKWWQALFARMNSSFPSTCLTLTFTSISSASSGFSFISNGVPRFFSSEPCR